MILVLVGFTFCVTTKGDLAKIVQLTVVSVVAVVYSHEVNVGLVLVTVVRYVAVDVQVGVTVIVNVSVQVLIVDNLVIVDVLRDVVEI